MRPAPQALPAAGSLILSLSLHGALFGLALLLSRLLGLGRTAPLPLMQIQLIGRSLAKGPAELGTPKPPERSRPAAPVPEAASYRRPGVSKRPERSAAWYQKAAEQGDAAAQFSLGGLHYIGYGVAKDYGKAVSWFRKSAEQGDVLAQSNLATMYYQGQGVAQDYEEAASWYRKAAEQGSPPAQYMLGAMYHQGCGVPKDQKESLSWYRKAADQGYPDAQYDLGLAYENGSGGVARDDVKALQWYRAAASQAYVPPHRGSRPGDLWEAARSSTKKRRR